MSTDFVKVAEALGGKLVKLVPRRAPEAGHPSPGMVLTLAFEGGKEVDLDEWLVRKIEALIDD